MALLTDLNHTPLKVDQKLNYIHLSQNLHILCAFNPKFTHAFMSKLAHTLCTFKPKFAHTLCANKAYHSGNRIHNSGKQMTLQNTWTMSSGH